MQSISSKWELSHSDRSELLDIALGVMQCVMHKDISYSLSQHEEDAYKAALDFMEREFTRGASKTRRHCVEASETIIEDEEDEETEE